MITNKHNLPESVVRLLSWDSYEPGEGTQISCTGLLKPPHMTQLEADYAGQLEEDVTDRLWSILGSGVHKVLEETAPEDAKPEIRWYGEVLGWRISGQADLYHNKIISDYKVTSVWSVINGKDEWVQQLNILAWLARENGFRVNGLEINVICRDWQKGKVRYGSDYPSLPIVSLPQPLWSHEQAQKFIEARVAYHQTPTDECTPEERWARPTKWAVMKKGRKSALRLQDTEDDAIQWAHSNGHSASDDTTPGIYFDGEGSVVGWDSKPGIYIEERPGEQWIRCDYCRVKPFCDQYKDGQK